MYTASTYGLNRNASAILAAAIVAFGGLVLDRAHLASAPAGIIEIGQLTPIAAQAQIAALPEIVVTAAKA